ncbi:MAG: hypothetical protein ACYC7D_08680 [Nitrososphaerales archaeon]
MLPRDKLETLTFGAGALKLPAMNHVHSFPNNYDGKPAVSLYSYCWHDGRGWLHVHVFMQSSEDQNSCELSYLEMQDLVTFTSCNIYKL